MNQPETSRFVRLRVELVLEVDDERAVTEAALASIADDADLPSAERVHAERAVTEDTAEALAHLVDPFALVGEVAGLELHQASWSSERIDYDPEAPDWDLDGDDGDASFDDDAYDDPYDDTDPDGDGVDGFGADGDETHVHDSEAGYGDFDEESGVRGVGAAG
ncbi:hypothetical protein ACS0VI_07260 [Streptomyces sp. H28]|uniref:hypothetical protein n=1 Tax=Streptomyces sp. H28 TaxID=2775865 RepID=UPI001CE0BB01|nr:hypothetical protein [Streptomyces sp. H28]